MILESIVTTTNPDRTTNVAPMGPIVDEHHFDRFILRPFQSSSTFQNLQRTGAGVLHVTDDIELFVDGALNDFSQSPSFAPAQKIAGEYLSNCCRYFEFETTSINRNNDRSEIECLVIHQNELRPFWGFNRAKHALLEAAILSTRLHILDHKTVKVQLEFLRPAIEKTGGEAELRAMNKLSHFFLQHGIKF